MIKIDKAVLLAAGRGTRMRELTADLPKPMIEVRGKPVLQRTVEGLREAGVREFLIIVGYRADVVQNFFGDGSRYNIAIQYATQFVQDGTGRVVDLARNFSGDSPFILGYGDILVDPANYKPLVDLPNDVEAIISDTSGTHALPFGDRSTLNLSLHRDWFLRLLYKSFKTRVAAQRIPEGMQTEFAVA